MPAKAARRDRGEGGLYKRASDGMWCASVELPPDADGRRRRRVICRKNKAKAAEELRKIKGELVAYGDMTASTGTLTDWLEYWLPNISAPRVRPRTYENQNVHVARWIIPSIGSRPLTRLTPEHIRHLQKAMRDAGKSSGYIVNVHSTLKKALTDAVREGRIRQNPCDLMDRPKASTGTQKALTLEQAIRLLAHLATREDRALWATFLLTGARRGEVIGLEADRIGAVIDFAWQLQRIKDISKAPADWEHRHVTGTLYLARPKSKAGTRIVPLVDPLRSILALHMQGRVPGLVFTEKNGTPVKPDTVGRRWKALLADAGLPDDVVLHGSRHTTVDLLRAAGVRDEIIQEIVGHSTRAMTQAYMTKGDMALLGAAMEKMSALLASEPLGPEALDPRESQGFPEDTPKGG